MRELATTLSPDEIVSVAELERRLAGGMAAGPA
jgi:hypothetical protein